jgi:hypothetical protein
MYNLTIKIICFASLFVLSGCKGNHVKELKKEETPNQKQEIIVSNNWNISFLLDLSDRIDPIKHPNESMDYYKRDIGYINSVAQVFSSHLVTKKNRRMNDKIQLFFDPEPLNQEINSISKKLKYKVTKDNITLDLLDEIKNAYSNLPEEIYNLAIKDGNYIGSETWRFFKNKIKDYCVEDGYRNILIILSDGYIYHEATKFHEGNLSSYITPETIKLNKLNNSNWKSKMENDNFGFIPLNQDLSNLEILVLGINPNKNNPYEEDIIKTYWKSWFDKMGVKKYKIKNADLPSNMEKVIRDFVLDN